MTCWIPHRRAHILVNQGRDLTGTELRLPDPRLHQCEYGQEVYLKKHNMFATLY